MLDGIHNGFKLRRDNNETLQTQLQQLQILSQDLKNDAIAINFLAENDVERILRVSLEFHSQCKPVDVLGNISRKGLNLADKTTVATSFAASADILWRERKNTLQ